MGKRSVEIMTMQTRNLGASTVEELEREMASLLAHARGQLLNESEMQIFVKLQQEIERRATLGKSDSKPLLAPCLPSGERNQPSLRLPVSSARPLQTPLAASPPVHTPVFLVAHTVRKPDGESALACR
jgi:hypothetical protein